MSIDDLRNEIPDYAKDIRLNLGALAADETLSDQQKWGAFLVSALATGNQATIKAVVAETVSKLSVEAVRAAKSAAAIMAMNNVYYRGVHLMSTDDYRKLPAKLRMNVIGNPGVEKADFELWCLAVSAINGCGGCLDSHEKAVRQAGLRPEQIQTALRIAAVVNAAARVLTAEAALA